MASIKNKKFAQRTWATAMQNTISVERADDLERANDINTSEKSQLYPTYGFWGVEL